MRDFAHAPKRQVHDAAPVDLTAGLHRRIPGRGDVAAGYCDQPMIGTIAIALLRGDIDSIDASRACGVSNDLRCACAVSIQGDKLAPINAAVETHTYKGVFVIVDHLTFQVR